VDSADLLSADIFGVLEREFEDALGGFLGDELDALHDTVHDYVLDAGVFALGVLSDQHSVHAVVWGLVSLNRLAGTDVGEEVEGSSEGEI
jgi:hypothetical protein